MFIIHHSSLCFLSTRTNILGHFNPTECESDVWRVRLPEWTLLRLLFLSSFVNWISFCLFYISLEFCQLDFLLSFLYFSPVLSTGFPFVYFHISLEFCQLDFLLSILYFLLNFLSPSSCFPKLINFFRTSKYFKIHSL